MANQSRLLGYILSNFDMIDLHTHSLLSDGVLLPSELARRGESLGLRAMAITDHVDTSNIDHVIPRIVKVCEEINAFSSIKMIPGAEITHVSVESISRLAESARKLGAKIVVVHGETIVEPVISGTNIAALNADIDILAHPGLITEEEAMLAKKRSILLEISGRKGHSLTNGHVASVALKTGASLIFNTDSHEPEDLCNIEMAEKIVCGAGLDHETCIKVLKNSDKLSLACISHTVS